MADTLTEKWSFMREIPTEIRLLIYEHALRSKYAVKKRIGKPASNTGVGLYPAHKKFALLFVSKQVMSEALPVLYEVNTISITHIEFCNIASAKRHLELSQIKHLKIRLDADRKRTWMKCEDCGSIDGMALKIASVRFPALQTAVVQFNENWKDLEMTRKELQRTGMDFECTKVGQFRVTGVRKNVDITFEHKALITAWEHVASLYAAGTEFSHFDPEAVCPDLDPRVTVDIAMAFENYQRSLDGSGRLPLASVRSEVKPEWLGPEFQNGQTFEAITTCLESFTRCIWIQSALRRELWLDRSEGCARRLRR